MHHLLQNRPVERTFMLGNEAIAQYKIRVGKRINSQPLIADGQHSRTDGLTSLAAAAGL